MIEYLRQIRESKGYDVNVYIEGIGSDFYPCPLDNKKNYDQGMAAAQCEIEDINLETMRSGKIYKLISLDNFVKADYRKMLLTITAKEIDANAMEIDGADDDENDNDDYYLITIQATVFEPYVDTEPFEMIEWKFKPEFAAPIETRMHCLILG